MGSVFLNILLRRLSGSIEYVTGRRIVFFSLLFQKYLGARSWFGVINNHGRIL